MLGMFYDAFVPTLADLQLSDGEEIEIFLADIHGEG